jgi:hypothetical protein
MNEPSEIGLSVRMTFDVILIVIVFPACLFEE